MAADAEMVSSTSCTGVRRERIADVVKENPKVSEEELVDEAPEAWAAGGSPASGDVIATSGGLGLDLSPRFRHWALL